MAIVQFAFARWRQQFLPSLGGAGELVLSCIFDSLNFYFQPCPTQSPVFSLGYCYCQCHAAQILGNSQNIKRG